MRHMKALAVSVSFAAVAVAAWGEDPPRPGEAPSYKLGEAPAGLAAGVAAADAAIADLQRRLSTRLLEEMQRGGPARAIAVCRDEAPALAAATARDRGLRIGRTSHRLRNAANAPPPWAKRFVVAAGGKKAAAAEPVVVDLGDRVGVLRPIPTGAMCTQCHGPADRLAPEAKALLGVAYPQDRAVGFEEGDLRGWFWVEASKISG